MRHLLIVGRHLERLAPISVRLHGNVHVMTLAVVDDAAAYVEWSASRGARPAIAVLDGDESFGRLRGLLQIVPPVLFLVPDTTSVISRKLTSAGGLILAATEPAAVILATLFAFSKREHRVEKA